MTHFFFRPAAESRLISNILMPGENRIMPRLQADAPSSDQNADKKKQQTEKEVKGKSARETRQESADRRRTEMRRAETPDRVRQLAKDHREQQVRRADTDLDQRKAQVRKTFEDTKELQKLAKNEFDTNSSADELTKASMLDIRGMITDTRPTMDKPRTIAAPAAQVRTEAVAERNSAHAEGRQDAEKRSVAERAPRQRAQNT